MPVCFRIKLNGNFRCIARAFYSHVKFHCVLPAHMWGPLWLFVMCILYNHVCFLLMAGVALFLCSSHISRKAPGPKAAAPCRIVILLSSLLFFSPNAQLMQLQLFLISSLMRVLTASTCCLFCPYLWWLSIWSWELCRETEDTVLPFTLDDTTFVLNWRYAIGYVIYIHKGRWGNLRHAYLDFLLGRTGES